MNKTVKITILEKFNLLNFDNNKIEFNKSKNDSYYQQDIAKNIEEQQSRLNKIMDKGYGYDKLSEEDINFLQNVINNGKKSIIKYNVGPDGWFLKKVIYNLIKAFGPNIDLNWIDTSKIQQLGWFFVKNEDKPTKFNSWHQVEKYDEDEDISNFNGNISDWDISSVTDLSYIFYKNNIFTGDISKWNTSNVKNMDQAFAGSTVNQDLSNWNVSNVKSMDFMFYNTTYKLKTDFSKWDVSHVSSMESMFEKCIGLFDNGLNTWKPIRCRNMKNMFNNASMFNCDLSQWTVNHVKTMEGMFANTSYFNSNINNWNVSRVENMSDMFYQADAFNSPLDKWDVSNVEIMDEMFNYARSFNQDISMWDVDFVESNKHMFYREFPKKYKPINFQNNDE